MCLLWFSFCHRRYQEDKVEDGRGKGQSGLLMGVGGSQTSTGARSPAVGQPKLGSAQQPHQSQAGFSHRTPVSIKSGGRAELGLAAPEEEEEEEAGRQLEAFSLCSVWGDAGNFLDRTA